MSHLYFERQRETQHNVTKGKKGNQRNKGIKTKRRNKAYTFGCSKMYHKITI